MAIYLYVDNSNTFIEGKRANAVEIGLAPNIYDAMNQRILDNSWRIDFGKLHQLISTRLGDKITKAKLFGSRPPQNDSVWSMAEKHGFDPVLVDRNYVNKEKKVDTGIITEMIKDAFTIGDKENDVFTLVAGDGDFVPAIETLKQSGFKTAVFFWAHASQELKDVVAPNFYNLNSDLNNLKH